MPKKMVYPRHAKAFAKPIRLDPVGRRQVGASKRIHDYVAGLKERGLEGLRLARAIVEDISNFRTVKLPAERAQRLWAKRSAAGACFFTRAFC